MLAGNQACPLSSTVCHHPIVSMQMTLRTVGESVVFDIGADMVVHGTSSSGGGSATVPVRDSVMRPARGLKLVVGMLVDSIARVENRRRQTREVKIIVGSFRP